MRTIAVNHKRLSTVFLSSFVLLILAFSTTSSIAAPMATFWVTSTADNGPGTLRDMLQNANSGDVIMFSVAAFPPSNPATIFLTSELPVLDGSITLDASDAGVILNGAGMPESWNDCLIIQNASDVMIRGIQFVACRDNGVEIRSNVSNVIIGGSRAIGDGPMGQGNRFAQNRHGIFSIGTNISGIVLKGNLVGTNLAGNAPDPNISAGITLLDSSNVAVGSAIAAERNLISGNNHYGLEIWRSTSVVVEGNYIGTNLAGTADLGNANLGILIVDADDIILRSNLVSGNESTGIVVDRTTESRYNIRVLNNKVGTNITGSAAIPNRINGIQLNRVDHATITDNLISGNTAIDGWAGLHIHGGAIESHVDFKNNIIGLDQTGTFALPNGMHGIYAQDINVTLGGTDPGDRNILSGNFGSGIQVENRTDFPFSVIIKGNYIGTNNSGDEQLGNTYNGVFILKAGLVRVEKNLISANGENGINLDGQFFTRAEICSNYIGTDSSGTLDFGNRGNGIWSQYTELTVGDGEGCGSNLISGNNGSGIAARGNETNTLEIRGNKIGTDITGQNRLTIGGDGVWSEGSNLIFGGPDLADRNLVSGSNQTGLIITGTVSALVENNFFGTNVDGNRAIHNTWNGITLNRAQNVQIFDNLSSANRANGISLETGSTNNLIYNNKLGSNATGASSLGNLGRGIVISGGANHNQVFSNLISGNQYGIVLHDVGTDHNLLYGNIIGLDISGDNLLPNTATGIIIDRGAYNQVGGTTIAERNLISGNGEFGIVISHPEAIHNIVIGNFIGVDKTGLRNMGNTFAGVAIFDGASYNRVGGALLAERNIISANKDQGINVGGYGNEIVNNYIGTDPSGAMNLGNREGIALHIPNTGHSGQNRVINNLIVGSANNGVTVVSNQNIVTGNHIGVDMTGNVPIGNGAHGIYLSGSQNIIGGSSISDRNIISANSLNGICLGYDQVDGDIIRIAQDNVIQGNYIGTNALGTVALSNGWAGVFISGTGNLIGGNQVLGRGNLISGNRNEGVVLGEANLTIGNFVQGNKVGTDVSGTRPVPNGDTGITIWAGVGHNTIGGDEKALGNLVAYNHDYGIAKWDNTELGEGVDNYIAHNEIHHNGNVGLRITVNTRLSNNSIYENSDNRIFMPASTIQQSNQIWSVQGAADSYFVHYNCSTCDLAIANGAALTIEPGVKVYLDYNRQLIVNGQLNATGTETKPVRITGPYDSIWSGDWKGIAFTTGSSGNLSFAEISYAQVCLDVSGTVSLSNSTVSACRQGGIRVTGEGRIALANNTIGGNFKDRYKPTDTAYDILNETPNWINAQGTWWGSVSGPSVERIKGNVDTSNWVTSESQTDSWQMASLLIEGQHTFRLDRTNDLDWYRIPITEGSRLMQVKLEGLPSDYDVFLFAQLGGMNRYPTDIHARRIKHIARLMNTEETQAIQQLDDIARVMFIGQYSSDDAGLDTGQLLRVSTNPGLQTENIEFDVGNQVGWYYILIAGNNGAHSSRTYTLSITTEYNQANGKENYYVPIFPPLPSIYDAETLIVTNRERLYSLYDNPDVDQLFDQLYNLALHPAVNGHIIDLSNCSALYPDWPDCETVFTNMYENWDDNRSSIFYANRIAATVKSLLAGVRTSYPNLKYIVIVGNDDVIPFWRTFDETPIASENVYGGLLLDQPIGAALAQNFFLTDDYFAQFEPLLWHGREFFLPEYAIGRLVETPEEMGAVINAFLENHQIEMHSALITGYDFLIDQAEMVKDELGSLQIHQLISNTWSTEDLTGMWFDNLPNFVSLNAHFSHWQAIPGNLDYGQPFMPEQILAGLSNSEGSLVYSVGCHAGLNVPKGQSADGHDLDFSQTLAQKGITWIANTGFGYGDQRSIAFSELLSITFLRNLKTGMSVGEALAKAKNDYYSHTGVYSFSPYDEKSLEVTALYGLPMLTVKFPAEQKLLDIQRVNESPCTIQSPVPDENLSTRALTCDFSMTRDHDPVAGDYFWIFDPPEVNMGQPIQPRISTDISLLNWVAHGVLFEGGTYMTYRGFDPVVTQVITDSTHSQPDEPQFYIPAWTPSSWDVINSVRTVEGLEQLLVLIPAQYKPETLATGTERVFDSMVYTIYYAQKEEKDFLPPFIWEIDIERVSIDGIIQVTVFDRSEVKRVVVALTMGEGEWFTVDLSQQNESQWGGRIPDIGNLKFFVQALDYAGNVAVADNKGDYYFFPYLAFLPITNR